MFDTSKLKHIFGIQKQRETELHFKHMLNRIESLSFFIDNFLLKGQDVNYIYVVVDIRVSKDIYRIIIDNLKKSKYKDKIRYCFKDHIYTKRDRKNLYIILFETPRLLQFLYLHNMIFFTLNNLGIMNDREDLIKPEIPPIFNTIENCYKKIGVYYTSSFGKKIFSYYKKNTNISLYCVNKELKTEKYGYVLEDKDYDIVLFLDLIEPKKVFHAKTGKEYLCFFWKHVVNFGGVNYLFDVTEQIIPQLIEKNIKVIIVNPPDISKNKYISKAIETSNIRDAGTKYLPLKERYRIDGKMLGDAELGEAFANTKGDLSKGYFRRFHVGDSYNFANGFRVVQNNKMDAAHNMYFFGSCISCGGWARDEDTFCNRIASEISDYYNVYSKTNNILGMNFVMRECNFKANDVVFIFMEEQIRYTKKSNLYYINIGKYLSDVPELGRHILDGMWQHIDKVAQKIIAEKIVDFIKDNDFLNGEVNTQRTEFTLSHYRKTPMSIKMYHDKNLAIWLRSMKKTDKTAVNGAIVMNCNPMTLGHMYLVEQARKQVDYLYLFIVEEDASEFSFSDRIDIVRHNVEEMKNVIVQASGKYVLSAITLNGYFSKSEFKGDSIDASDDLELFLTISKYMNITYRFVGSEPEDKFTRLYNEAMKEKLPEYGVDVIEIERLKNGDRIISASDVRKFIADKNWDAIKKIVPPYTYRYIIDKFGHQ